MLSPRRQPSRVLQYNATTFRMTIIFFCREIYILSLGQAVFQCTKIRDYLSDDNLMVLQRNICLVLAKRVLQYNATTFRMTILLFCREIYAQSQPRRVLQYNATTFQVTIIFFCREIYIFSLGQAVFQCTKIARLPFG